MMHLMILKSTNNVINVYGLWTPNLVRVGNNVGLTIGSLMGGV